MHQFSSWYPLTEDGLFQAPRGAAAIQIRHEPPPSQYPAGRSAMVWYGWSENVRRTLLERFGDEVEHPGARGMGPLQFRICEEADAADVAGLVQRFEAKFGSPPRWMTESGLA